MPTIQITQPAVEPVSSADVKAAARIDDTSLDAQIAALIPAFRVTAEHETGRRFVTQTVELVLDAFPPSHIDLTLPDALSITSIKHLDGEGAEQTLSVDVYQLDADSMPSRALLKPGQSWPATQDVPNAVRVRFTVGYGPAAADVPSNIRMWITAHVCQALDNPSALDAQSVQTLPYLDRLLDSERFWAAS